jgi:hypothetical protein
MTVPGAMQKRSLGTRVARGSYVHYASSIGSATTATTDDAPAGIPELSFTLKIAVRHARRVVGTDHPARDRASVRCEEREGAVGIVERLDSFRRANQPIVVHGITD